MIIVTVENAPLRERMDGRDGENDPWGPAPWRKRSVYEGIRRKTRKMRVDSNDATAICARAAAQPQRCLSMSVEEVENGRKERKKRAKSRRES